MLFVTTLLPLSFYCGVSPGNSLEVVSQSSYYNATGEFRCSDNGVLFYFNKTRLVSNKTKCLATAQWEDYDIIQCWTSCDRGLSRSLEVVAQSSVFNAVGEFRCRNDGVLFYSNKTRLVSIKTKCLATAHWKDSGIVQCWTAPSNVSLLGNLTATEGDDIYLKCDHQSSFPASNGSFFFFNGAITHVEEGGVFTITKAQKEIHNKSVFCQVQSSYVELVDQSSGRSQQRFINVFYRPYSTTPQQCTWMVNTTGICRVRFQSNPNAQFRSLFFNGADISDLNVARNTVKLSARQQYFIFFREKVDQNFTGIYQLVLYSNGFDKTNISFQINVVDQLLLTQQCPTFPKSQIPTFNSFIGIICFSIAAVFSIISIILLIVYWRERYCLKE